MPRTRSRASKRLTLNYGLRWEPAIPWNELRGRMNYFKPSNYYAGIQSQVFSNAPVGLLFRGDQGVPPNIGLTTNYTDFMPRLGFAYDLLGDGKTSLRGGAGMFYDTRIAGDWMNSLVGQVVPSRTVALPHPTAGDFQQPAAGRSDPFPPPPPHPRTRLSRIRLSWKRWMEPKARTYRPSPTIGTSPSSTSSHPAGWFEPLMSAHTPRISANWRS